MARPRVVILGGGFGGLTVATELRERLGERCEVVLVDGKPGFRMGFRKIWMLLGRSGPDDGVRPRALLAGRGVRYVEEEITRIDPAGRAVETTGPRLEWDYLVVALGAEPRAGLVPGFDAAPNAYNLYDAEGVLAAHPALAALERGRLLVAILGLPFKCPPAPYEAALLLADFLEQRGRRDAVSVTVTTPQATSLPAAGQAACDMVETLLAGRGVRFVPKRQVERVTPETVEYAGASEPYDLLLGVPPHRPPAVVRESGLCDGGDWVPVDPATLRTRFEGVYAIGDVNGITMANGLPLPKAGVFAEAQGTVVAGAIAAAVEGRGAAPAFDGRGSCFIEVGRGLATLVTGHFLAPAGPEVALFPPSREHLDAKVAFEVERLRAWFGR